MHHSADFLLARIGLLSTRTNTGLVWLDGKMRRHTQLLVSIGTEKATSCSVPSARISFLSTGRPLTTTSMGTFRVEPMRALSSSQYGLEGSGALRMRSVSAVGFGSRRAATRARTSTVPALARRTSLPFD